MRDEPFVRIAKALADPTRLQMLREIRAAGELTCSGVCCRFALSQPTISHHIKTLQESGLIKIRREGQYHVLSVDDKLLADFSREFAPRPRAAGTKPGV